MRSGSKEPYTWPLGQINNTGPSLHSRKQSALVRNTTPSLRAGSSNPAALMLFFNCSQHWAPLALGGKGP